MDPPTDAFLSRLVAELERERPQDKQALHRLKHRVARATAASGMPRDGDILAALPAEAQARWRPLLLQKPMRTQSGVAVLAVMSSPEACPHGRCVFCPGGPEVDAPQSYTGFEPSTMRARAHAYDPYRIARSRLWRLERNGHPTDKVDVIVQGGTFPARDPAYQDWAVAGIYAGLNDGADAGEAPWEPLEAWQAMDQEVRWARLDALKAGNESARHRCIGLTVETKPDWCLEPHVDRMLRHGVTRVELGLQTFDEETLRRTHRGHGVQNARDAMRVLRDAGLKVCVHMMPGLPRWRPGTGGAHDLDPDPAMDLEDAKALWDSPDWRPDMLKVYPTLVVQEGETPLKRWWREGRYEPYDTARARQVVAAALAFVPPYCRIQRIDRDIPTTHVVAGVQNSNLRQMAEADARALGTVVRDLRAREAGTRLREGTHVDPARVELVRRAYDASGGEEVFLSFEDPLADAVVGFVRLRRVGPAPHRPEMQVPGGAAVVRELKVFGAQVPLGHAGAQGAGAWQHQGFGGRLLAAAEAEAEAWGCARLLVTAGVGVKAYYLARGYHEAGPYVARELPCSPRSSTSNASSTSCSTLQS